MILAWLMGTALASTVSVAEVPNPQADHSGWVTDLADLLPPTAEARIEARLEQLHLDLDAEIALVTVHDVDASSPKAFATELFNTWGLGDEQANNGLLVLMVVDQRRLEMETGYGLEPVLPDSWLGGMQAQTMVPRFRDGDFAGGLERGMEAIDARLRGDPVEVREGTRGAIPVGGADEPMFSEETAAAIGLGGVGGTGALLGLGGVLWWRRRERTCPECKVLMPMLDEEADDEHLDAGQQTEEMIRSINYKVHQCPQCARIRTFRGVRFFSGHSSCPRCGNRTRTSLSTTVVPATQYSTGRRRIDESCAHCSYSQTYHRTIPRLPPPSSSSSSSSGGGSSFGGGGGGGGSFGGGSSGGGGAGSSW